MGKVSFGVYLIHPDIYAVLLMTIPLEGWSMVGVCIVLAVMVAEVLRRVVPWSE